MKILTVERQILKKNDEIAAENRRLFQEHSILVLNLLSSPGSGKTTLLEKTLEALSPTHRIAVVEGDVQTDNDARRIAQFGVPVVQVVTRGGCHLEAALVQEAIQKIPLPDVEILFIENVGNLVCPANYDLGEDAKIVIMSVTEGEDKPLKYPPMFRVAQLCIFNKIDLLPYVDFQLEKSKEYAQHINPQLAFLEVSAKTGEGMSRWFQWVEDARQKKAESRL